MTSSKTYLNVPFAEKDTAKALGARWDAANKKWYAPNSVDVTLFAKWASETDKQESLSLPAQAKAGKPATETLTRPGIKDFVAYNGELPPWD